MIGENYKETSDVMDRKIANLLYANSYKDAEMLLVDIENHSDELSTDQLNRICSAALTNDQIKGIYICKIPLKRILLKNKDKVDESYYKLVMDMMNE